MVIALGPGKFYGSSLPRPRFYSDVKFSDERVDPPAPVTEPLLSWAADAHWSMGGLSFKRLRLQGRIEGNVERLRKQREKTQEKRAESLTPVASVFDEEAEFDGDLSDSPPPSPIVPKKRKSRLALLEEGEEEDFTKIEVPAEGTKRKLRRLVRKLKDDFDLVADDAVDGNRTPLTDLEDVDGSPSVGLRTRSRRSEDHKTVKVSNAKRSRVNASPSPSPASSSPSGVRISPRLSKLRSR